MYLIDVQGTLIDDHGFRPIPGAVEFISALNDRKVPYVLITNNTKCPSREFFVHLIEQGFPVTFDRYLDPFMNLEATVPEKKVFVLGTDAFKAILEGMGYELTDETPEAVIIGLKTDVTGEELADAAERLLAGARLVGMHQTTLIHRNGKRYLGVGAIVKALEYASGKEAVFVGKPALAFFERGREILGAESFEAITIVSDDVKGDLLVPKELGMKTLFVLSGKYKTQDEVLPTIDPSLRPDRVLGSVAEITPDLEKGAA